MPSAAQDELARASSLVETLKGLEQALEEFDRAFDSHLNGSLGASLASDVEELCRQIEDSIRWAERQAAIVSKEVWVSHIPGYSEPKFGFEALLISQGRTPGDEFYYAKNRPAMKAGDFRNMVNRLVKELRSGAYIGPLGISASDLIQWRMSFG